LTKSNKVLKGGTDYRVPQVAASQDVFTFSNCKNNPGTKGTWDSLGCDMGNVFTGIGNTFENGFGAIGNMINLGEIIIE
jgi:hypothetical protein